MDSDVEFTQGGTIHNRKLYYTFGYPKGGYPLQIMVFDLQRRCLSAQMDNLTQAFRGEEIECIDFYGDRVLCNTCDGSIFELEEGVLPL